MPAKTITPARPAAHQQTAKSTAAREAATGENKAMWVLEEPVFGYANPDGSLKHPSTGEVLREWWDAINIFRNPQRLPAAFHVLFHLASIGCAIAWLGWHFTWASLGYFAAATYAFVVVTHTVWLHRYCTHRAFEFRSRWFARVFLWLNGLTIREDTYCVPHRVHHQRGDRVGDPHGPHMGRLGSYLAIESMMKINTAMTPEQYRHIESSVQHIGFPVSTYEQFQRTGTIEHAGHMAARTLFAQVALAGLAYLIGGVSFVLAHYAAVALVILTIRDFNYFGHGGSRQREKKAGWEFDQRTLALNQIFYGIVASEWHNNHHMFPRSANTALTRGQIDVSFWVIRLMRGLGIVSSYVDAAPRFRQRLAEGLVAREPNGSEFANTVGIADGTAASPVASGRR